MIAQYYADGFLKESFLYVKDKKITTYWLTWQGRSFIENGGYKTLIKDEDRIKDLKEKQITSVIDTNRSVKTTNRFQIGSLMATGIAIIVGAVFQVMSWNITKAEYKLHISQDSARIADTATARLNQKSLMASIDSIHKSLDTISSKIQRRK